MLMQELKLRPVLCMCVVNSVTKYLINTLMPADYGSDTEIKDANVNGVAVILLSYGMHIGYVLYTDVQPVAAPYAPYPVTGKPTKPKKPRLEPLPEHAALPYGALDTMQYYTPPDVQIVGRDLDSILLCSHELMLPDQATLHTRMLLGAWEAGLEGVSEEAAQLLMLAVEVGAVYPVFETLDDISVLLSAVSFEDSYPDTD